MLEGGAALRIANEMLPLLGGDVVFIPPGAEHPHQIIDDSDVPPEYLSISSRESPEFVQYADSGKDLTGAAHGGDALGFARMHRNRDTLDDWDGQLSYRVPRRSAVLQNAAHYSRIAHR